MPGIVNLPRLRLVAAFAAALLVVLGLMAPRASAAGEDDLTVMTQNLYLGSSLAPALEAKTPGEFVEAVARIYATVQYTNFPARAQAIANQIQETEPDLIGLQEVTKWTTEGLSPPPGYDFLEILQAALEERGLDYEVAAVAHNAKIGPMPLVVSEETCPVLEGSKFSCGVTLEDRDAILVNAETPGLTWSNPQSGEYATQEVFESPVGALSFDRGWAGIDADLNGKSFAFVDTHLETEAFPATQEAQAAEFLEGPGAGETTIATGDFNSAADGSTTASYAQLTAPGEFGDAWDEGLLGAGFTCCQESNTPPLAPGALNNPVSTLKTRIDLILTRGNASSSGGEAEVVGDAPFQAEPPFWSSDHAGVVAQVSLSSAPELPELPEPPEPPAPEPPPADTAVDGARVKAVGKQLQGRHKALRVKVWMKANEAASAIAWGKIQVGKRTYPLKKLSGELTARERRRFALEPAKPGYLEAIREHLSRGDKVTARVTGRIVDAAGNVYERTVRIALRYKGPRGKK